MEETNKQLCLKELSRTDRPERAVMKTPYWEERLKRPIINGKQAVLAYEIYHKPSNPSEHETIRALNELIRENKAKVFFTGNTSWYVKV